MNQTECPFEADVLAAVLQSRWPGQVDETLRAHAATCPICSEVAAVASAMEAAMAETRASAELPDASRVWWKAQMRARREAVSAASSPIATAQVLAFAFAVGLMGACFGATSTWFQGLVKRAGANATGPDVLAFLTRFSTLVVEHSVLVIGVVALVCLVPTAMHVARGRE
jgi:hypothetical protein